MPITPPLDAARITALTGAETRFTRHGSGGISCVARTDSTNATLVRYVREGGTGSRVLIADRQDAGHGRFSRSWQAPAGTSLLMSVLVPVSASRLAGDWGWLSMAAGLAVTEAVELDVDAMEREIAREQAQGEPAAIGVDRPAQ